MDMPSLEVILYTGAVGLVVIGAVGMVTGKHFYRMLLALTIAEAGANLLLVLAGYRWDAVAPILRDGVSGVAMVDPVPQAMVLTAIVIGVGIQAFAMAVLIQVYRAYGTLDVTELRARMEADIADAAGIDVPGSQQAPAGQRPLPPAGAIAGEGRS